MIIITGIRGHVKRFFKKRWNISKYFPIILCWTCQVLLGLFFDFSCFLVFVRTCSFWNTSELFAALANDCLCALGTCYMLGFRTYLSFSHSQILSRIYKIFYNARAQEKRRKHKFYIYIWKCFMSTVKFYKIFAK